MIQVAQPRSITAFLLTVLALFLVSSFISLQVIGISAAKAFCSNFGLEINLEKENVSLVPGEGELVKGDIANTGFDNEYQLSTKGPEWVAVRPQIVRLETSETSDVFVYMSPDFGARGVFDVVFVVDGTCVNQEKTIKAEVQ